ncbi:MAG: hypothetical protein AB7O56_09045 [Bauldia sp.]
MPDPATDAVQATIEAHNAAMRSFGERQRELVSRRTQIILIPGPITPPQRAEIDAIKVAIDEILVAVEAYNIDLLAFLDSAAGVRQLAERVTEVNAALKRSIDRVAGIIDKMARLEAMLKTANAFLTAVKALIGLVTP